MKWTQKELDKLDALAGVHPLPTLIEKHQAWAKKYGFPVRSGKAIRSQLTRCKLSRKTSVDVFCACALADELGVKKGAVVNWIRYNNLPVFRLKNYRRTFIRLPEFRQWAIEHPHLLVKVERDRLLWAMDGNEELTDRILASRVYSPGVPMRVRHVATGQEFKSMTQAAKAFHYQRSGPIKRAIELGIFEEVS